MTNPTLLPEFHERLTLATAKPPDWKSACVRGGNAGFYSHGLVQGGSNSCPRRVYLRSRGIEERPRLESLLTWEVGHMWEALYARQGALNPAVAKWSTQVEVYHSIAGTRSFFSGRPDHVVDLRSGERIVVETKSISSHNKYRDVICDGKIPPEYLAQVVAYMNALHVYRGVLAFGAFIWAGKARGVKIKPTVREFAVTLECDTILVDGVATPHTVSSQIDHSCLSALTIETGELSKKRQVIPNACGFCPLSRGACAKYDFHPEMTTEDFVMEAQYDFGRDAGDDFDPEGPQAAESPVLQSAV